MSLDTLKERVISVTEAADQKNCGRATVYRALNDDRLSPIEIGGRKMVLKDKKYEDFCPRPRGTRVTPIH